VVSATADNDALTVDWLISRSTKCGNGPILTLFYLFHDGGQNSSSAPARGMVHTVVKDVDESHTFLS
jgi:hypothetical protein